MPAITDLSDVKRDFDLQGYAHLAGVFDAERIDGLRDKLDRFLVDTLPGVPDKAVNAGRDGDVIQVKALNKYNAEFDALFLRMKDLPNGPERQQVIDRMVDILRQESPWLFGSLS